LHAFGCGLFGRTLAGGSRHEQRGDHIKNGKGDEYGSIQRCVPGQDDAGENKHRQQRDYEIHRSIGETYVAAHKLVRLRYQRSAETVGVEVRALLHEMSEYFLGDISLNFTFQFDCERVYNPPADQTGANLKGGIQKDSPAETGP